MACERTVVVLLIFLCHSWYPRAEAANGEGRWSVRSYLISNELVDALRWLLYKTVVED